MSNDLIRDTLEQKIQADQAKGLCDTFTGQGLLNLYDRGLISYDPKTHIVRTIKRKVH